MWVRRGLWLAGWFVAAASLVALLVALSASGATRPRTVALKVTVDGSGTLLVTGSPSVTCRAASCRHTFHLRKGRRIAVHALAAPRWYLTRWSGACHGSAATCSLKLETRRSVAVIFSPVCERNPHDGVYAPDRLTVVNPCATFQGTVSQAPVKHHDGDVSFNVSPDPGYANMLNATNRREGGLHMEIVPRDQPGCTPGQLVNPGAPYFGKCSGRDLLAPPLGAHVRIIGPWVLDIGNHWYEIHPVWSVHKVK